MRNCRRDLVKLPGGPLAVAFGGEWRREKTRGPAGGKLSMPATSWGSSEISPISASRTVGAAFVGVQHSESRKVRDRRLGALLTITATSEARRTQSCLALAARALAAAPRGLGTGFRAPSLPRPLQFSRSTSFRAVSSTRCAARDDGAARLRAR
jgi:hypothetical protein